MVGFQSKYIWIELIMITSKTWGHSEVTAATDKTLSSQLLQLSRRVSTEIVTCRIEHCAPYTNTVTLKSEKLGGQDKSTVRSYEQNIKV